MKNKKSNGITTMELIITLALIGLLLAIVLPIINNTIKKQKDNLYNVQIENIIVGAKAWAGNNIGLLPEANGDSITVMLGELKYKGYVKKDITNPKTEKRFSDAVLITISKINNAYLYNVDDSLDITSSFDAEAPFIMLYGSAIEYAQLNDLYNEKGVKALTKAGAEIDIIEVKIRKNNQIVANITTEQLNTYIVTYTVNDIDTGKTASISRYVVIKDNISPVITVNGRKNNHTVFAKKGDPFTISQATVTDNSGQPLTAIISGSVNTQKEGNYELIYEAKDANQNVGRLVLTVIVKDLLDDILLNYGVSTEEWTNQNVSINIEAISANPLHATPYSFDGGLTWVSGTSKSFSSNQLAQLQVRDINGTKSSISEYRINNIDKTSPTCNFSGPEGWYTALPLTLTGSDNESGVAGVKPSTTYISSESATINISALNTYTGYVKDKAGNEASCAIVISASQKEYRYRNCSTCKRCSGAGCETYNAYTYSGTCKCTNKTSGSPSSTSCTSSMYSNNTSNCTNFCNTINANPTSGKCTRSRTCKTYYRSCSSCSGCDTFGSWSSWSTTYTAPSNSRGEAVNRTVYKVS